MYSSPCRHRFGDTACTGWTKLPFDWEDFGSAVLGKRRNHVPQGVLHFAPSCLRKRVHTHWASSIRKSHPLLFILAFWSQKAERDVLTPKLSCSRRSPECVKLKTPASGFRFRRELCGGKMCKLCIAWNFFLWWLILDVRKANHAIHF